MRRTRILGAVGLLGAALAALVVVDPEAVGDLGVAGIAEALGGPWVLVAVFGAVALVFLFVLQGARAVGGLDEATPPDPEGVHEVPHPGHGFDEFLAGGVSLRERLFGDRRERVRDRIREAALATLTRSGMSREAAQEAIETGAWTDDPTAAAFLATDRTSGPGSRVGAFLRGESAFGHGARRAVDEIAERRGNR